MRDVGRVVSATPVRAQYIHHESTTLRLAILATLAAAVVLVAALASLIVPCDPYAQDLSMALRAPGPGHLLGTDRYGRDLLSRIIMGGSWVISTSTSLGISLSEWL